MDREAYARLQARLEPAWRADLPGSTTDHLVVALPSLNLDPVLLAHYADRVPALEQRYLCCILLLRHPATRVAFVTSTEPPSEVVEAYLSLLPAQARGDAAGRLSIISADDPSPRPLADKLLERPDLVGRIRSLAGSGPALIEPWNVTEAECRLAIDLDMPLYGAHPDSWSMATKSAGRRLFREVGVPLPDGCEDVSSLASVVSAIAAVRHRNPALGAAIVKLDNSASGDGNAVIDLSGLPPPRDAAEYAAIAVRLQALPGWYVETLSAGRGIVEARIDGDDFRSPSAQLSITPDGEVHVVSTHDQLLGGHAGQVFQGCTFPADPRYAPEVARLGAVVARRLAAQGVIGRLAVDFAAVRVGSRWDLYALEINLRKGGTTHPFATAALLTGGRYDHRRTTFAAADGTAKHYVATDNLVDPGWQVLDAGAIRRAVGDAGLGFDQERRVGVVPHMMSCVSVDGRFGLTAIGDSLSEAQQLYDAVRPAVDAVVP